MKTDIEIRDDIYAILKGSEIHKAVTGKLCNKPQRPNNSSKEDICINVLSNEDLGRKQAAVVQVNVYCPDINHDGQMEENTPRLRTLVSKLNVSLSWHNGGDYYIELKRLKTYEATGTNAHFAQAQLAYIQNND